MRLFVAVEAGEEVCGAVAGAQSELGRAGADVNWTGAGKAHVTLKFLGETDGAMVPAILGACRRIAGSACGGEVELAEAGTFGGGTPRVVWIGLRDRTGVLARLAAAAEDAFAALGFARESRPFRAHLTIGRVRSPRGARALLQAAARLAVRPARFPVRSIALIHSTLAPGGSAYEILDRLALRPPDDPPTS